MAAAVNEWAAQWLGAADVTRILELPRRPMADDQPVVTDVGRRQRLAAVVSAFHTAAHSGANSGANSGAHGGPETVRSALLLCWSRVGPGSPVGVFTAGVRASDAADGTVRLGLPAGASGVRCPPGDLLRRLRAVPCWTRLDGVADGLLVEDVTGRPDEARPSLDECLLQVWHGAFTWFVLAEPVPPQEIAAIAGTVAAEERAAQSRASSPEHAVLAARLQHRHRELRQGSSTGLWRVHVLAGGDTPADAAAVAGLLSASADLDGLPYTLIPGDVRGDLDTVLTAGTAPFLGSSLLLASLAVPPIEEVPGIRMTLRSEFDVTAETSAAGGYPLGAVLDRTGTPVDRFAVAAASLNRHTFVCGATGTGKSQTVRGLLEAVSAAQLPWLVVEPAKAEYRQMADRIGTDNVIAIRPGDADVPPAGFNPLRPAPGFPLQTHLDLVRALYLASFEADEPFPQVLGGALTRCYEDLGWDLALGEPRVPGTSPRWPTLGDLQRTAERVVDEIGYGKEVTDNVRGFIRVRLSSLRVGTTGRFFEGGHPLDLTALMRHNVVFEIEDVGDDRDKAFLMGALLIQLVEHLRVEARRDPEVYGLGLRHLSVFEEAHRLLRRSDGGGASAQAVELFAAMLAEIRAYGEGLIIAEQIPSKLVPDVIKNTAVKVMHRLPALDDREAVGATINLSERQSRYLVTLPPGTGAVFTDGMDQPILVRMPDGTARERGGRTPTAPVDRLIGRRSSTCGGDCRAAACTLRDMRTAQHLLANEPWIVLWAELGVLGHLTGWPVPVIRAEHMRTLFALPARLRDCALSHAVDDAVAVRSSVLSSDPSPTAVHVVDALDGYLAGSQRCEDEELQFLARPYRWSRLHDELAAADPAAGRHPRSARWAATYGRPVPGSTTAEQLGAVTAWFDADLADPAARRTVALGASASSALERSVGVPFGTDDWPTRVKAALDEHFAACTWPERYLLGPAS